MERGMKISAAISGGTASTPSGRGGTRPSRKHPTHPAVVESFNKPIIVFVTVCTTDKIPVLACKEMHDYLLRAWNIADHWVVGQYVIMPDHIHLFCAPKRLPPCSVRKWVEYWKSIVARACKGNGPLIASGGTASTPSDRGGTRPSNWPDVLWQRDCWDTQLRRGESYTQKWEYVSSNPVRAGLCSQSEEWPLKGKIKTFVW